jgi:hypothetical protein
MVRFEPLVTFLASLPLISYAATIPMAARGVDAAMNAHLLAPRANAYWMETTAHNGTFPEAWGGAKDYKVFRNVKDYGAVGDGVAVSSLYPWHDKTVVDVRTGRNQSHPPRHVRRRA